MFSHLVKIQLETPSGGAVRDYHWWGERPREPLAPVALRRLTCVETTAERCGEVQTLRNCRKSLKFAKRLGLRAVHRRFRAPKDCPVEPTLLERTESRYMALPPLLTFVVASPARTLAPSWLYPILCPSGKTASSTLAGIVFHYGLRWIRTKSSSSNLV
jgi:hypothetical protein